MFFDGLQWWPGIGVAVGSLWFATAYAGQPPRRAAWWVLLLIPMPALIVQVRRAALGAPRRPPPLRPAAGDAGLSTLVARLGTDHLRISSHRGGIGAAGAARGARARGAAAPDAVRVRRADAAAGGSDGRAGVPRARARPARSDAAGVRRRGSDRGLRTVQHAPLRSGAARARYAGSRPVRRHHRLRRHRSDRRREPGARTSPGHQAGRRDRQAGRADLLALAGAGRGMRRQARADASWRYPRGREPRSRSATARRACSTSR